MTAKAKSLFIRASLLVMGLAGVAQAQTSSGDQTICPPFCNYLTPSMVDFVFPGLSTNC